MQDKSVTVIIINIIISKFRSKYYMKKIETVSGLSLSQLSLGCMNLPLNDEFEIERIIDYSLSQGINYFDTADFYQFGENEEVVGRILKKYRNTHQFYIGTKGGNDFDRKTLEPKGWNPDKQYIKTAAKESLSRLNVDVIDLYQLHGGTIEDNKNETINALEELKTEGIIRSYGISSIRMNVIDYYKKNSDINTLMMQFNPIDNRPLEVLNTLEDIVLFARGPLFKGLFTHNFETVFDKKFNDGFLSLTQEDMKEIISNLRKIDSDLTRLSYRFLDYHNAVIVNGVSSFKQLEDNIESFKNCTPLSKDEYDKIYQVLKILKYEDHRK